MRVYAHDEVAALAALANKFGAGLPTDIIDGLKDASAPYLVVIFATGVVYLYCLTKEADWNVLLLMRNAIQSWISIPQLAGEIVAQIQFSLNVPADAAAQVVQSSPDLVEADFRKDRGTSDRIWAGTRSTNLFSTWDIHNLVPMIHKLLIEVRNLLVRLSQLFIGQRFAFQRQDALSFDAHMFQIDLEFPRIEIHSHSERAVRELVYGSAPPRQPCPPCARRHFGCPDCDRPRP
jgi:hypothetical protein